MASNSFSEAFSYFPLAHLPVVVLTLSDLFPLRRVENGFFRFFCVHFQLVRYSVLLSIDGKLKLTYGSTYFSFIFSIKVK